MYRNLIINTAGTAALAAAAALPNVRIRQTADGLQIRPTDRAKPVNLPKGELLRPLGRKTPTTAKIALNAETLPDVAAGTRYELTPEKYGWFTLSAVDELARGAAGASVSA